MLECKYKLTLITGFVLAWSHNVI